MACSAVAWVLLAHIPAHAPPPPSPQPSEEHHPPLSSTSCQMMWRHQKAQQEDEQHIAIGVNHPLKGIRKVASTTINVKHVARIKTKRLVIVSLEASGTAQHQGRLSSNEKSIAWRKNGGTCLTFMVVQIGILVWRHL